MQNGVLEVNKKIITIVAMFLLALPLSFAALNDDLQHCFTFDDDSVSGSTTSNSVTEGGSCTINGATTGQSGIIGEAFDYDGSSDYLNCTYGEIDNIFNGDFTYLSWINPDTTSSDRSWAYVEGGGSSIQFLPVFRNTGLIGLTLNNNGVYDNQAYTLTTNVWRMMGYVRNGSSVQTYTNATITRTDTQASGSFTPALYHIGEGNGGGKRFSGLIDQVMVWNRTLNNAEMVEIYNSGDPLSCSSIITGGSSVTTITAADEHNTSYTLSNFTVTIYNSTYSVTNTTTTASLSYDNLGGSMNLNFSSDQDGGYFNRSFSNINLSTDYEGKLYQAILRYNASEVVVGTAITDFNVTFPLQFNESNSSGIAT